MKNYLLFLIFIILSLPNFSQSDESKSKWKLGVKIAQNDYLYNENSLATISHVISYQLKSFYFTLGANAEYQFNNYFSLVTGLEYSNRNYQRSDGAREFTTYKSNLIQLPIALRFYPKKDKIGFFIQSGFIFSYDLSNYIRYYDLFGHWTAALGYDFKIAKELHLEFYTQFQHSQYFRSNYSNNNLLNLNIAVQKAF